MDRCCWQQTWWTLTTRQKDIQQQISLQNVVQCFWKQMSYICGSQEGPLRFRFTVISIVNRFCKYYTFDTVVRQALTAV